MNVRKNTNLAKTDGRHIYVAGTYKPRIKCFDFQELSLKFERCLDAEIVDMLVLSDDYQKLGTFICISD